jgi:DMSO/TMAO reductase YedYZ molybdopterin-dependent catalytic subunit
MSGDEVHPILARPKDEGSSAAPKATGPDRDLREWPRERGEVLSDERRTLERQMREAGRLPPGQSLTLKWPVLHAGAVPRFDPATWDFRAGGLVESRLELTYVEFQKLPRISVTADFHCVTKWSAFDNRWEGVPFREILARVKPASEVTHVMALGHVGETRYGYTTNVPLADLDRPDVLLASRRNGEDLAPDHGWPLRLIVPHLYAWKSCKWLRGLIFMGSDKAGYWERHGYHMYGDPWQEQRFAIG